MTRARCGDEAGERGFTLVELVVAIVIMGLVIVPLCTAVNQALTLVPQSGAREQTATDNSRTLAQLSQDIVSATAFINGPTNSAFAQGAISAALTSGTIPCGPVGGLAAGASSQSPLVTFFHADLAGVPAGHNLWQYWQLSFTNTGAKYLVQVQRYTADSTAGTQTPWETLRTAYCTPGTTVATVATQGPQPPQLPAIPVDGSVKVTLQNLFDRSGTATTDVIFAGSLRATYS